MNKFSFFKEICDGHSKVNFKGRMLFIKHNTSFDLLYLDDYFNDSLEEAKRIGRITKEEALNKARKEGKWTAKDDESLSNLYRDIKIFQHKKLVSTSEDQMDSLVEEIEDMEKRIFILEEKKSILVYNSAESFAGRRQSEKRVATSIFTDQDLTLPLFTNGDEEYEDDEVFKDFFTLYFDALGKFSHENIRKLCITSAIQNLFFFSDKEIFNKPVVDMSVYQINFIRYGKRFKEIMDNVAGDASEDILDDPDKLEELYYLKMSGGVKSQQEIAKENSQWDINQINLQKQKINY